MNPEDELSQRWINIGRMVESLSVESLSEAVRIMPLLPELEETLWLAALKRGSRRPHGGLRDFW